MLESVAPAQLAQHDLVGAPAHILGAHDFVGVARLEYAVLVDARGMGERVGTDHCLVGLHHEAGSLADHAARRQDVLRFDAHVQVEIVAARFYRHDDLFQRAVASALTEPVDGAFDLACAADLHAGQRVGHSHAEVVVAMH